MTKRNHPRKNKRTKKIFSFNSKYLIVFFAVCFALFVILATVMRATQQQLMKTADENTQQIRTLSLQLQKLQRQENQYEKWWENERSNKIQNRLYDVLYKLKLANLYFNMGSFSQAKQLLIQTQPLLRAIGTKQSDVLNQKVDVIIEQLVTLTPVDINQTILVLDQINQTIEKLPVLNQAHTHSKQKPTAPEENASSMVKQSQAINVWRLFLNQLKQLIIIHHSNDNESIFFKENTLLIRQTLTQKILQMQLALLKNNFELYQHNTDIVITWLKEYFSLDKKQLNAVIQQLQNLRAYTVTIKPQSIDFPLLIKATNQAIQSININDTTMKTDQRTVKKQQENASINQTKQSSATHMTLPITPSIEV
jgi:uncharacterized protein HemX